MLRRFYAPPEARSGSEIYLDEVEAHHLKDVLRLGVDSHVTVLDGAGREFRCVVRQASRHRAQLEIIGEETTVVESPLDLTLCQALVKGEKFDWLLQKATELGVYRIVPLITQFTEVRLKDESASRRMERWRRISIEAVKQSGRRSLLRIDAPMQAADAFKAVEADRRLFFNERGGVSLKDFARQSAQSVAITIGPEGGWHDREIEQAEAAGWASITLGPRILRAETAAVAAISLVQHLFGDLS